MTRWELLQRGSRNALVGWLLLALLVVVAVVLVRVGEYRWAGLAATLVGVAVVPPVARRRPAVMITWEVLLLGGVPPVAGLLGVTHDAMVYVAVAALALVVAVELDAFTAVEMTPTFAVGFVVIVTMAVAGLWTIVRYASDVWLHTSFVTGESALMWDLVGATAVGVVAGLVFEVYVRRASPGHASVRDRWR